MRIKFYSLATLFFLSAFHAQPSEAMMSTESSESLELHRKRVSVFMESKEKEVHYYGGSFSEKFSDFEKACSSFSRNNEIPKILKMDLLAGMPVEGEMFQRAFLISQKLPALKKIEFSVEPWNLALCAWSENGSSIIKSYEAMRESLKGQGKYSLVEGYDKNYEEERRKFWQQMKKSVTEMPSFQRHRRR